MARSGGSAEVVVTRDGYADPRELRSPGQRGDASVCSLPVPKVRCEGCRPLVRQDVGDMLLQVACFDQSVSAFRDRDRSFDIASKQKARNSEVRALLLHSARVRDDGACGLNEVHEGYVG